MAIRANVGLGVQAIGTGDTVLIDSSNLGDVERYAIQAISIHNTTASTINDIEFYISPDLTSASGDRVAQYSLAGNDDDDVIEIIAQGYKDLNLIAVAGASGVNCSITITEYNGGD